MAKQADHSTESKSKTQYRMTGNETVEVTLCGSPAVPVATFLHTRSAGPGYRRLGDTEEAQLTLGFPASDRLYRQVFGYATAPWINDYYGDMLNPIDVIDAQNTFMKNMQNGTGYGIGEEHYKFFKNAHVVASCIDYTGSIGGIPGGWWLGVQVDDTTTWEKVMSGEYTGFSISTYVRWKCVGNDVTLTQLAQACPNLVKVKASAPAKERQDGMKSLGIYTYPDDPELYADSNNVRLPIDTAGRALMVLDYLLTSVKSIYDGYEKEEYKAVLVKTVNALTGFEIVFPETLYHKLGLPVPENKEENKSIDPKASVRTVSRAGFPERPEIEDETEEIGADVFKGFTSLPNEKFEDGIADRVQGAGAVSGAKLVDIQSTANAAQKDTSAVTGQTNDALNKKEEPAMNPDEIKKAVTDGISEGVAAVLKAMADADAKKAAEEAAAKKAVEESKKDFGEIVKSVVETLKADGVIPAPVDKSEKPIEEVFAEQYETITKNMKDMQDLISKVAQRSPGALSTRGLLPAAMSTAPLPAYPTFKLTSTDGDEFTTTKEDYDFVLKWAEENKYDCDTLEENMRSAAAEGILPSQKVRAA